MGEDSGLQGRAGALTDRRGERGVLDQLIDAVRAGGSRVLVVRGEPGVGKSALLEYLAGRAAGCRVARAVGCSQRWSRRSPGCISCCPRCWTGPAGRRWRPPTRPCPALPAGSSRQRAKVKEFCCSSRTATQAIGLTRQARTAPGSTSWLRRDPGALILPVVTRCLAAGTGAGSAGLRRGQAQGAADDAYLGFDGRVGGAVAAGEGQQRRDGG